MQPDQHVAGRNVAARQDLAPLDGADGEPCEIIVLVPVHARHLGRLAADEGAPGFAAALRNAGDHVTGALHLELAGREVIQEEQRLCALHDEIVDAHGNEVNADRRVPARIDGDLELGADAVVGGNQDRIAVTGGLQVEQTTKTAEISIGACPPRRPHQWLNRLDQRIAGIDVDAGITVGNGRVALRRWVAHARVQVGGPGGRASFSRRTITQKPPRQCSWPRREPGKPYFRPKFPGI